MSYNNNKFSYTLLILSIIFLLFVVYKSEVIFSGEKRDYYYTYYILTFIFILVSFISFFLSNKLKIYFKIICITLFFGIYILEISIHIYKQSYNTKIQISAATAARFGFSLAIITYSIPQIKIQIRSRQRPNFDFRLFSSYH